MMIRLEKKIKYKITIILTINDLVARLVLKNSRILRLFFY